MKTDRTREGRFVSFDRLTVLSLRALGLQSELTQSGGRGGRLASLFSVLPSRTFLLGQRNRSSQSLLTYKRLASICEKSRFM